jgi:hypothetical protein
VRLAASVFLGLTILLVPRAAHACSFACAPSPPTLERCKTASRVFAGTVDSYDWPLLYAWKAPVPIHLSVDSVWRGEHVPARLVTHTYLGGCSLTSDPPPGMRFLICDDEEDDAPPSLLGCRAPLYGDDEHTRRFAAELGPPGAPEEVPWIDPSAVPGQLRDFLVRHRPAAVPFLAALLGALVGRLVRWRRPAPEIPPLAPSRFVRRLLLLAACVVLLRWAFQSNLELYPHIELWSLGLLTLAAMVGLVVGYRGQRRPAHHGGAWRALGAALFAVGLVLVASFTRLHFPVQPEGAVECSVARARAFLAALDAITDAVAPGPDRGARIDEIQAIAARNTPYACTDWGLQRMRLGENGSYVYFDDGHGAVRSVSEYDERVGFWWEPG